MTDAIFLSASVPDPRRSARYAETADSVAIAAAVSALLHVTLGRRLLVWGGHPAITPIIWVIAESLNVNYGTWVRLYQSEFFKDEYPEDNQRFKNVTFTPAVAGDRDTSLRRMRETMFADYDFTSAVFIGGMEGILQEFDLLYGLQPRARMLPVTSTGGATLDVAARLGELPPDLSGDLDYIGLFHRHLDVSVKENRYQTPEEQPLVVDDRLWQKRPLGG